jgi:iron(III) transport system permease protein
MIIMSLALFPYVYVIARTAFLTRFRSLIEASQTLGATVSQSFFKVILPVTRPALVAGLSLVTMEVLNDYGAVTYYGVTTFTTGIFRSWFSLEDIQAAIYLSAMLLMTVFIILLIEKYLRGQERFFNPVLAERPLQKKRLLGVSKWMALSA